LRDIGREALAANTLTSEARLATRLRQFFRAVEARDEPAVQDEIPLICHSLWLFLEYLLEPESSWDSRTRWFDGLIKARYGWISPGRFHASGELVWGLISDAGPQWAEPFSADVSIIEGRTYTASYCLRFGRRDDIDKSELPFGSYPGSAEGAGPVDPWAGKADWKYEFRKAAPTDDPGAGDRP